MPERPFVDTNVLLYLHDRTAGEKRDRALGLMNGLTNSESRLCLSVQVLQEFFVNATRKLGMDAGVASAIVADLTTADVHAPGPADVLSAIDIQKRHQLSFWDSMIVRSAAQLGCDVVWTEDLSHGQTYEGVVVHNPFRGQNP
jgi:predicted nucleic acid-binding protein